MKKYESVQAYQRRLAYQRAYYAAHREQLRAYFADPGFRRRANEARRAKRAVNPLYAEGRRRAAGPVPDIPQLEVDDLTARAMVLAGFAEALESEYDAGWRDIVQEAALALLEGRDPREAARAARSEFRRANQLFIRDPQLLEELAA